MWWFQALSQCLRLGILLGLGHCLHLGPLPVELLFASLLGGDHRLVLIGQRNALIEPQRLVDVQRGGTRNAEIQFAYAVDDLGGRKIEKRSWGLALIEV